ncbi:hypothetical protein EW146_g6204 [Bondarzewia mesenterica]|uniref:N-acetyltransferase domain-containing protein n=1 Tax=Bondarzewia mesenterica TaxID=1095465 RepID=A0A4S4LP95_9AGAM|nr:hypothetical protein EW146_g6204 [Bondarzewia mesenterica]
MKLNANLALVHPRVLLVPYSPRPSLAFLDDPLVLMPLQIQTYHAWMQSPDLRHLTASEELSLDDEYAMQQKWQDDPDKLTFIVLACPTTRSPPDQLTDDDLRALPMIGDVNLFLNGSPQDHEFEAEIEVMIAGAPRAFPTPIWTQSHPLPRTLQTQPTAANASLTPPSPFSSPTSRPPTRPLPSPFAKTVSSSKSVKTIPPSIRLFEGLGFTIVKTVAVFEEVEMRLAGQAAEWVAGTVRALEHGQVDDRPSAGEPDACGS